MYIMFPPLLYVSALAVCFYYQLFECAYVMAVLYCMLVHHFPS